MTYEALQKLSKQNFTLRFNSNISEIPEIKDKVFLNKNYSYIKWKQSEISLFSRYLELSGGKTITSDVGYAAFENSGDSIEVYEFCAEAENINKLMCVFNGYTHIKEYNFNLPVNYPIISDSQKFISVGMIKPLTDINIGDTDVYIGITLN